MNKLRMPNLLTIFGLFMVVIYFIAGFWIFFAPGFEHIPQNIRGVFGFFMIVYGFFRLVRIIMKLKAERELDKDEF